MTAQRTLEEIAQEGFVLDEETLILAKQYFNGKFINKYSRELSLIKKAAGTGTGLAYYFLPKKLIKKHSDILIEIAKAAGTGTGSAYQYLPKKLIKKHSDILIEIAKAAGTETGWAYHNLPKELVDEHSHTLIEIAKAAGTGTGWAYCTLPKKLIKKHSDILIEIAKAAGTGTGSAYYTLPKELLNKNPQILLRIAEIAGEYTYSIYRHINKNISGNEFSVDELDRLVEILAENKKIFGIEFFQRYIKTNLLSENLKNIQESKDTKPLAVIVQNKSDYNGAFCNQYYILGLVRLSESHRTFIYEADNYKDAFSAIAEVGNNYGAIDVLVLAGHGNPISLLLGKSGKDDTLDTREELEQFKQHYISVLNQKEFEESAQYLSPDAQIVLVSCSTGKGGKGANNLANAIAGVTGRLVHAPEKKSHIRELKFDENNRLADVVYRDCGVYMAKN